MWGANPKEHSEAVTRALNSSLDPGDGALCYLSSVQGASCRDPACALPPSSAQSQEPLGSASEGKRGQEFKRPVIYRLDNDVCCYSLSLMWVQVAVAPGEATLGGRQSSVGCAVSPGLLHIPQPLLRLFTSLGGTQDWWHFAQQLSWAVKPPAAVVIVQPQAGDPPPDIMLERPTSVLSCRDLTTRPAGL